MNCLRKITAATLVLFCSSSSALAVQQPVLVPETATAAPTNNQGTTKPTQAAPAHKSTVPAQSNSATSDQNLQEGNYPLVDKMEMITFGKVKTNELLENRLNALELAVFLTNFKEQSLFDRTQKLKLTILGASDPTGDDQDLSNSWLPPLLSTPSRLMSENEPSPEVTYFELIARNPENQVETQPAELSQYALQLANYARSQINLPPLTLDPLALRMADEQMSDLRKRKLVSHANMRGENPDLRYTVLGGTGAIVESVVSLKPQHIPEEKYTKALVAHVFKLLFDRQDDRDALLSPDATGLGFSLGLFRGERKAVACLEVSTNRATMSSIASPVSIGEKVEVKGSLEGPYKFAKFTLAWEGLSKDLPSASDEGEEALPYFPPLDYVGYAHHSEHDYGAAMTAVRVGCLVGIIAGSMFMPPVALAAPLVAFAPGPGEPKAMSDIPLHSGVKVDGDHFAGKVTVSNGGKPGIYYLTVWATTGKGTKPVPISRRAYMVTDKNSPEQGKHIAHLKTQS